MTFSTYFLFVAVVWFMGGRGLYANRPVIETTRELIEWEQLLRILQGRGGRKAVRLANGSAIAPEPEAHRDFMNEVRDIRSKGLDEVRDEGEDDLDKFLEHKFLEPAMEDLRLFSHEAYYKVLEHYAATHGHLKGVFSLRMSGKTDASYEAEAWLKMAKVVLLTLKGELHLRFRDIDEKGASGYTWPFYRKMGDSPNSYVRYIGYNEAQEFELTIFKPDYYEITDKLPYWAWKSFDTLLARARAWYNMKAKRSSKFWAGSWREKYEEDPEARAKEIEAAREAGLWL